MLIHASVFPFPENMLSYLKLTIPNKWDEGPGLVDFYCFDRIIRENTEWLPGSVTNSFRKFVFAGSGGPTVYAIDLKTEKVIELYLGSVDRQGVSVEGKWMELMRDNILASSPAQWSCMMNFLQWLDGELFKTKKRL